ncbi:MAG: Asp23/Gls24 family envelope stress response protein [Clostridiales Family XIII bacterium]|jgi:uncharacterized alkaline shock family protein YloU|nr:Asp23/Gls24 family envelope stress response protein [Clostridiales Family XIII bacterium]
MKVYSLVGKSGTGKSYQAGELCSRHGIEGIIDDGLFIVKGRILAGISAKRQDTKVRAIKTALFTDDEHMRGVAAQIEKTAPRSLLVLGTSDKMIRLITGRLGLPDAERRFDIEDITSAEERAAAWHQRHEMGKHVIPAPTVQIKKDFSGYFYHPIRMLRGMTEFGRGHSVVRPTYSYLGEFTISDRAIRDIVGMASRTVDGIEDVPMALVHNHREGAVIELCVVAGRGWQIVEAARRLQRAVTDRIEEMTSINVIAVDVEIQALSVYN